MPSLGKLLALARRPAFASAVMRHRTAAAVEHLEAISFARAGTLIDVGANKGQFSLAFRALRPGAPIVAFEPLPDASATYQALFKGDRLTELHRTAASDKTARLKFYVADRHDSSSLLKPGQGQEAAYGVKEERVIEVDAARLDETLDLSNLPRPIMMKIDVQGAELSVLEGLSNLADIDMIYVELSFVELYEGQPLFDEVSSYLNKRGFRLRGVFNQSSTAEFGPTQVDCLFVSPKARVRCPSLR